MGVNQVYFGDEKIMDITDSTVEPEDVLLGSVFYAADGERKTGLAARITIDDELSETSENPVQNKVIKGEIDRLDTKIDNKTVDVDDELDLTSENPVQNKVITESLADEKKARFDMFPTESASGSIASFADGADSVPVKSLLVNIAPVQNLNGYDNPWPAGGGKNKFNPNSTSHEWVNGANQITTLGSAITNRIPVTEGTTVWLSQANAASPSNVYMIAILDENDNVLTRATYASGQTALSKTVPTGGTVAIAGFFDASLVSNPQFEVGSSATTFTPYENICPIGGWNSVTVNRTGKNVWDEEWEVGRISTSNGQNERTTNRLRSKNYIPVTPSTTYYFLSNNVLAEWFEYDANKNFLRYIRGDIKNSVFTTGSDCYYRRFVMYSTYGTTYNNDISINYPATDTEYHAYQGNEYTIQLGETVYGGTLDVTSGVLTIDHICATYGADNNWTKDATGNRYTVIASDPLVQGTRNYVICNIGVYRASGNDVGTVFIGTNRRIYYYPPIDINTLDLFRDWLTANPIQVCYELATPTVVQLTPTEVTTLLGVNNIWADTGDVDVTYRADVQLYVNKKTTQTLTAAAAMLSNVEADMTATRPYAVNDFLSVNGQLYRVTAAIANGATITPGTNVTETTVGAQITALLNS